MHDGRDDQRDRLEMVLSHADVLPPERVMRLDLAERQKEEADPVSRLRISPRADDALVPFRLALGGIGLQFEERHDPAMHTAVKNQMRSTFEATSTVFLYEGVHIP